MAVGTGHNRTVALAGLASAITQSLSMGAVVYTSTKAERDLYFHAESRERRQIEQDPAAAREDVRAAYVRHGFNGGLLDAIVARLTSDKELHVGWFRAPSGAESPDDEMRREMKGRGRWIACGGLLAG